MEARAFAAELTGTFTLVLEAIHTAAIGLTLIFCILMGGPLTGASLNPARTLGPGLFTNTLDVFWVYLAGTLLGAALAGGLYRGLPRGVQT